MREFHAYRSLTVGVLKRGLGADRVWSIATGSRRMRPLNPDDRRFAGQFFAASYPNRLLASVIALVALSGCTRFEMLNATVPHCGYIRTRDMLLAQGSKDQTVDPANTSRLADRIRAAGGDVRTIFYPNRAHVGVVLAFAYPFRWLAPVLGDTTAFFHEHESGRAPQAATTWP